MESSELADLLPRFRAEYRRRGISIREIGEQTGLSVGGIHKVIHGRADPRLSTIIALVQWMETPAPRRSSEHRAGSSPRLHHEIEGA